jgi:cytochrome c oxidase subunit 2
MRGKSRLGLGALLTVIALLGSACAKDAPQDTLRPAGPFARDADRLWDLTFAIAVVVFVIVEGLLVYALIKFRARPGREAAQFHGNTRVEVVLTVIPALLLAGLAVPTVATVFDLAEKPKGDFLDVTVIAHQFWWEYRYPEQGIVSANEMNIPTDKPIYLTLRGAVLEPVDNNAEVIHSFWVPRLGGTQDVVPGRINHLKIQADEPGTYLGQCKEFCGLGHPDMRLRVIAHTPADFDTWVAGQQAPAATGLRGDAADGEGLFEETGCTGCHAIDPGLDAQPRLGPNLTHIASRTTFAGAIFDNNASNLADWLADPPALKPGAKMPDLGLSEDQISALVAYLQALE